MRWISDIWSEALLRVSAFCPNQIICWLVFKDFHYCRVSDTRSFTPRRRLHAGTLSIECVTSCRQRRSHTEFSCDVGETIALPPHGRCDCEWNRTVVLTKKKASSLSQHVFRRAVRISSSHWKSCYLSQMFVTHLTVYTSVQLSKPAARRAGHILNKLN